MVTKEEWNDEINKIRKCLNDWDFPVELTPDESEFFRNTLDDMVDELNHSDWDRLQTHLGQLTAFEHLHQMLDEAYAQIDRENEKKERRWERMMEKNKGKKK